MLSVIKKILYLLPEGDSVKITLLFFMMMGAALLEVAGIGMIPAFVSIIASPDMVMNYEPIKPILGWLNITDQEGLLLWGSGLLVGIFVLKSIYVTAFNYIEARYVFNRRYIISYSLMKKYMYAPYTFHLGRNSSELLRNISLEVNIIVNVILTNVLKMSRETLIILAILILLLASEPLITLIVCMVSLAGAGSFIIFTKKRVQDSGEREQKHRSAMIKAVNQGIGGIKDARVLNRENEFIEKFRKEAYGSTRLMAYIRVIQQIPKPIVETSAVLGMMLIAALMVWQGRPMSAIFPILTLFAMATVRLMPAIQTLSSMYTNMKYNMVALDPIYNDFVELEEENLKLMNDRAKNEKISLNNRIEVSNVSYSYPNTSEQALQGVSFVIPKGKAVAFVGESGAGKTTIVDLLLGLMKPTEGKITVDGKDIHEQLSAWQKNIGYIPQSIYLADETLRNNIAFGIPEHLIDDEKIEMALESAQLTDLVSRLPEGLDTFVGENGTRLSGGQKQRVGIARALYHNPEVLVMDEATSALDNITEKEITRAIESLIGERTIVMIAHRLTTVQKCDTLYLMENGKIVDAGDYNELVGRNDVFRSMALVD